MEFIDGHPVTETKVRFRQRAVVPHHEADRVKDSEVILWLVKARCLPPQYYPVAKDADDRYKLAIQEVEAVAPLDGPARESAIAYLDHGPDQTYIAEHPPALPFDAALAASDRPTGNEVDEVEELRELLAGIGQQRPGERLAATVRRLLWDEVQRIITTDAAPLELQPATEEHLAAMRRATAVLNEDPPPSRKPERQRPDIPLVTDGDTEIVGRVYRRSNLHDMLDNAFGDPT